MRKPIKKGDTLYFYDLGTYDGREIDRFIGVTMRLRVDYQVHSFEAHPQYAEALRIKYAKDPKVHVHNLMIGDSEGLRPLWLSTVAQGHSMYASKNNATKVKLAVDATRFSQWTPADFKQHTNILRCNIEGAEWPLFNDLIETGLYKHIKLFLGATPGIDILKCGEIKNHYEKHLALLKAHGITIHPFCTALGEEQANIHQLMKALL